MATKADVIAELNRLRDEAVSTVEAVPSDRWDAPVDDGWNAWQLLYHIASTSGVSSFVLQMSKLPPPPPGGEPFDNDAFNRDQVASREGKSPADALDEIRANIQRDIQALEAADESDIQRQWTAPWGMEGSVADIIITALEGHLGTHLDDLRTATS